MLAVAKTLAVATVAEACCCVLILEHVAMYSSKLLCANASRYMRSMSRVCVHGIVCVYVCVGVCEYASMGACKYACMGVCM